MTSDVVVAIGGVGGSGTRLIAQCLKILGCYIGSDLNQANDNLWFTLLFKQSDILDIPNDQFVKRWQIFCKGMVGKRGYDDYETDILMKLAFNYRPQYNAKWLIDRVSSLQAIPVGKLVTWWGWKEPNTHVVIERLNKLSPILKYIHVVRNGLDMAYSANQNQPKLWGNLYVGSEFDLSPSYALKYWCAVHKRILNLSKSMGNRFLLLNFDNFCIDPQKGVSQLLEFLEIDDSAVNKNKLANLVNAPATIGRYKEQSLDIFDKSDIEFVRHLGFDISL